MTRDNIIRMAREAGFADGVAEIVGLAGFANFAKLVAAAEREACETAVEDIARKYQKAHEASLENIADECAAAIRARETT